MGPVVLALALFTQRVPAPALEVQGRRIHEHHGELAEEIPPPLKQLLLQHVLGTAWRQSATRLLALRQLLTKPIYGAIEMMEFEFIDTIDAITLAPMFTRPVGARHHQAMQHRQEHRAFDRELETPPRNQILHNGTAPPLLP